MFGTKQFPVNISLMQSDELIQMFKDNGATIGSESFTFTETTDINGVNVLKASGVKVNGNKVQICALEPEDVIDIGGVEMTMEPISAQQVKRLEQL